MFQIWLKIESPPTVPVGPTATVLAEQGPPKAPCLRALPLPSPPPITETLVPTAMPPSRTAPPAPTTGGRLFNLIQGAFTALKVTNPDATTSCWLCLAMGPPYYEGTAIPGTPTSTMDHNQCPWGTKSKLTLTEVSGSGLCIGRVPPTHQHLCNISMTLNTSEADQYLLPSNNSWWACSTGLTPCVSTSVFNQSKDFCVRIQLVPRAYYHSEEVVIEAYDTELKRVRRELVSLTLAVMLGLGLAAGIGTGTTALIKGPQDLQHGLDTL